MCCGTCFSRHVAVAFITSSSFLNRLMCTMCATCVHTCVCVYVCVCKNKQTRAERSASRIRMTLPLQSHSRCRISLRKYKCSNSTCMLRCFFSSPPSPPLPTRTHFFFTNFRISALIPSPSHCHGCSLGGRAVSFPSPRYANVYNPYANVYNPDAVLPHCAGTTATRRLVPVPSLSMITLVDAKQPSVPLSAPLLGSMSQT